MSKRKVSRGTYKKAIRKFCLDCVGGQRKEVALCTGEKCPLWPYRMGTDHADDPNEDAPENRLEAAGDVQSENR